MTAFVAHVTPLDILCDFTEKLTEFGNIFGCDAKNITETLPCDDFDNEELQIQNPKDLPAGKTEEDLEGIWVKDLKVPKFPKNLYKKFWKLKVLDFDGCDLDGLRSSNFFGLDFLLSVNFKNNKLKKLSGRLFRFNRWLRKFEFGGNSELNNVGFNLFGHLRYLRELDFGNIGCGSFNSRNTSEFGQIASKLFGDCPPDPEDTAKDMDNMECNFTGNTDKSKSTSSKGN